MKSLYLLQNPTPEPPSGFMKFCSDVQFLWDAYILPPDLTPEQKIQRELAKLKTARDSLAREADELRSDMRIETKLLRQYERDRDHNGIERAIKQQVRTEKKERFLLRQVDKKDKCIEEVMSIKGDHEQTLSLLIVMNATNKKSVSFAEAQRITQTYKQQKMNNDQIKDMVELALGLSDEDEDGEQFNEADQIRVDELIKLSKDVGDQRMMENIPVVTGIPHENRLHMENMSQKELELKCKMDEKKLENFLMGMK